MKLYLLFLSLFLNCVNLEELKNAEPMHYLTGVIVASVRGTQTSSSDQASFQIQGTLKDSSGNPIANATLSLSVSQNILSREIVTTSTKTDSSGNYSLNLRVGNFSIKVTNSSGVEIGSFSLKATSTTAKPEIGITSGNLSVVVNTFTNPSPISEPSTGSIIIAPSNLSYPTNSLIATVGKVLPSHNENQFLLPSVTGINISYSIAPNLPNGLRINSSTGAISGVPTASQSKSNYIITASNNMGITYYNLAIGIYSNYTYSDNGDGTVTQSSTGLIWQKCSVGQGITNCSIGSATTHNWESANSKCNNLSLAGKIWRLPRTDELYSLVQGVSSPFINNLAFPNTISSPGDFYYGSRRVTQTTTNTWFLRFDTGNLEFGNTDGFDYVRCVSEP